MNVLREILTPINGQILVTIPKEYQQKRFEVIVIPIEEVREKDSLSILMDKIGSNAKKRGLTSEILADLLNE